MMLVPERRSLSMDSQDHLPSASDLDLVVRERELIEVSADQKSKTAQESLVRTTYLDLKGNSILRLSLLCVALFIGSGMLRANSLPVVFNNGGSNVMGGVY